ncbi:MULTISPECIES: hypothetical protein [Mesorhizobium]|jgi:hypothetical protein|uniref:hypothetical protein n=1 Tax=Mesorhizobium sp. TaxID=1871066 RepID=UPI0004945E8B|nr:MULTISPECIES: hypothetical protein [Mesorhizobium]RWL21280.1 MAG: hypothetical protein EOR57_07620 [Mesorhizobium sp.]RWM71151.1 MAG: hypothetical protein EOR82_19595 [Mesorhizobium sp.]TIO24220.1 MAG: hypothetical protein E5X83_17655 [Mesorhizobium sp.]TIQ39449.1 MAG: hypothetical protein E5X61_18855 [Mesorhizobium sp.]TJV64236.1 MAG: hypothetical protein E5X82_00405 [Mesorhizobium sp.]
MGEVRRAIERDVLGEHKRQADFRGDQHLASLLQLVCERYSTERGNLYLIGRISEQSEMLLSIWLWPDEVVDCEIAYDGSKFEIVATRAIAAYKEALRGRALKDFQLVERVALSEQPWQTNSGQD